MADFMDIDDYDTGSSGQEDNLTDYLPNAPVTEANMGPPEPLKTQSCNCRDGQCHRARGRTTFCCASWGQSCSVDCDCRGLCRNIWNAEHKERLFGPGGYECIPHACFVDWYKNRRIKETVNMERLLAHALKGLAKAASNDEKLKTFQEAWEVARHSGKDDPERQKLAERLVRYAFTDKRDILGDGDSDDWGWFLSLCGKPAWITHEAMWHCWACGECKFTEQWHCEKCNKCAEEYDSPCDCGGVGSMYHSMKKAEQRARAGSE